MKKTNETLGCAGPISSPGSQTFTQNSRRKSLSNTCLYYLCTPQPGFGFGLFFVWFCFGVFFTKYMYLKAKISY